MEIRKLIITGIYFTTLLLVSCTGNSSEVINGGLKTAKVMIEGSLFNLNGTPAEGAIVNMRLKDALTDTTGVFLEKTDFITATFISDNKGKFIVDSIEDGTYSIECSDGGNNLSIYEYVQVEDPGSTIVLPPDTLKPAGAIKGVIRFAKGGNPGKSLVLVFGIDRFARVESDGYFNFTGLAEGIYNLRIVSSVENYEPLDINDIKVSSGNTTSLDTIVLQTK